MQIGYTEKEIGRMHYGKWMKLYEQYRIHWNMMQNKVTYKEKEKETSVLDL